MLQPIVFLGPSLPVSEARAIVDAIFRPPVRRGDLEDVAPGRVVALIDGVFEQSLAISPREIYRAIERGVTILGGSSMGALRAAEVPGVIGIGRVYDWYRDGVIARDDEVSLLFDEQQGHAVTVPMVNVRFAVERLCRPGTLDRALGDKLIEAALDIPYERRRYRTILKKAGLGDRSDFDDLIVMLEAYDLKREDAQAVLEAIDRYTGDPVQAEANADTNGQAASSALPSPASADCDDPDAPLFIWESGDTVEFEALREFLALTGKLDGFARAAISRFALEGNETDPAQYPSEAPQMIFDTGRRRWGWHSTEEAKVTMADLGLSLDIVSEHCSEEAAARAKVQEIIRDNSPEFRRALRSELFLNDQSLKRETMRCAALVRLAKMAPDDPITAKERADAQTVLCKLSGALGRRGLEQQWAALGFTERRRDTWIERLVSARRVGFDLVTRMRGSKPRPVRASCNGFALRCCPKPPGEPRFSRPLREARELAEKLCDVIGITRVGLIGELSEIGGVQVAQAARPQGRWSSTYGSGKSCTVDGAIIGSIMEETEKWAQEQFLPRQDQLLVGSYRTLADRHDVVDPSTFDLPFDSAYHPDLELHWYPCFDLLSGGRMYLPVDMLRQRRGKHDICYTLRGARKTMATNGLGCGFAREEAVLHGICEYVERHAERIAELFLTNPGGLGQLPYRFIDLATCCARVQALAEVLRGDGGTIRILDITSDVGIPTFTASIIRDYRRIDGHAAHPNPDVAVEMALLEAAQAIAANAAGGREDLSIQARSLGRHERPRPISTANLWTWLDPDPVYKSLDAVSGLHATDVSEEVQWCIDKVATAGANHLIVADLTTKAIAPAHVVRILVDGLETNNPFYTGPRARMALLRDMLPKWR